VTPEQPALFDHSKLVAEIETEVARRRASGDLPADLEHELDTEFSRFAPVSTGAEDVDELLLRAESTSRIHPYPPVGSTSRIALVIKRVVALLIVRAIVHVTDQVSAFSGSITRAMRLLATRVDALEQAVPAIVGGAIPDEQFWIDEIPRLLGSVPRGRVVHMDASGGAVVAALCRAGYDAYGIDIDDHSADAACGKGVDIRVDGGPRHLAQLPDDALAGAVLSGVVEVLPGRGLRTLVGLLAAKLAPGGRLAIVSTHPSAWAAGRTAPAADLAYGRPVRPETWRELLTARGFADIAVHDGPRPDVEVAPPSAPDPDVAALVTAVARINEVVFGPTSFAVTASAQPGTALTRGREF
jgi:hypothetical protein